MLFHYENKKIILSLNKIKQQKFKTLVNKLNH